ncbi:TraB/GumN family protein [uncultured Cyclobacterium sp.]|uniref:TraB/GumN family protein n=1 Tax=uncultured Cyclobacterium sp. TaxID=453820 RepID=UPI0030ECA3C0|tara:strand:+ start:60599 stop:61456 length:858 start_codon:yes stop_codon:yes gene_type:complete
MLKGAYFIWLFFLGYLSAFGQEEEGVFWEISSQNNPKPSYLFGTIHLICEGNFTINPQISEKISETDVLVLEVDLDDPALQGSMRDNLYNKDGQKIKDFLSKEEYLTVYTFLKERTGMDMDMLQEMRPMVLMSLIYNNLLECETKSFENELMILAKEAQIEVTGLETFDDQMSLFDHIPLKSQYRSFYSYVNDIDKGQEEFRKLIKAYKEEKILALLKMVSESPEYNDYQDLFLSDRNKKWVAPMTQIMNEGSAFIAVGAGHLGGPNGILNLLKNKGYEVNRIYL